MTVLYGMDLINVTIHKYSKYGRITILQTQKGKDLTSRLNTSNKADYGIFVRINFNLMALFSAFILNYRMKITS